MQRRVGDRKHAPRVCVGHSLELKTGNMLHGGNTPTQLWPPRCHRACSATWLVHVAVAEVNAGAAAHVADRPALRADAVHVDVEDAALPPVLQAEAPRLHAALLQLFHGDAQEARADGLLAGRARAVGWLERIGRWLNERRPINTH
eukprot:1209364-Alexandrium_andersonii.AAC.1